MKIKPIISFIAILSFLSNLSGQVQTSGQLDVVVRNPDAKDNVNKTFAGFSNFDFVRARIFFDAQPAENVSAFTQVFITSEGKNPFQLYAAYIRILLFEKMLNIHAGIIPNTVGIWGPRTYSDKNPFIGIPLLQNYHTAVGVFGNISSDINDLLNSRGRGFERGGLPILYDFCWNTGVELFGSYDIIDWSIAALSGSVSYPERQLGRDLPSFTSRMALFPNPELNITFSAFWGPYLNDDKIDALNQRDTTSLDANDYINQGLGLGLIFSREYIEVFSEVFYSKWDNPFFGDLSTYSGYIDFKYKFATQWYWAVRGETMRFSKIEGPSGKKVDWDYPLNRFDFVLGYKMDRNVIFKLNTEVTNYPDKSDYNDFILATQISISF